MEKKKGENKRYYYQIVTGEYREVKKMILFR